MITKYFQAILEFSDFSKLSSLPKAGWVNSTLILIYNDY